MKRPVYIQAIVAGMLLLLAGAVSAQDAQPVFALDAIGRIDIGPDGTVMDYTLESELSPVVADIIDRSVRTWRFEPITVDGQPVIATTRMHLQLEALPRSDGFVLRVENVWFGEPSRGKSNKPPRYPRDALRHGIGARVVMVLQLDATGHVERMHVEQSSLSHRTDSESVAEHWREKFEKTSRRAAEDWTFNVSEFVDGEPVNTSVRVPVEYIISDSRHDDMTGKWRAFIPGPYHPVPWVDGDALAQSELDALGNGDMQTLESRFKLKEDVVGSML